jgi:uncharacterized protein YeaO (DUF488 family)
MVEGCGPKRQFAEMVHHDPVRWIEFRRRYFTELKEKSSFVASHLGSCPFRRRHADLQLS